MAPTSSAKTKASALLQQTVPDRLWHYTSFSGSKSIVEESSIFATDIRFLNDAEEFIHTRRLLKEMVKSEQSQIQAIAPMVQEALAREIDDLFEKGPLNGKYLQTFVACFSESRDQLSQWRGYSNNSTGVSIGFDLSKLRQEFDRSLVGFAPCIYEEREKNELLRGTVQELFHRMRDVLNLSYEAGGKSKYPSEKKSREEFEDWFRTDPSCSATLKQLDQARMDAAFDLIRIAALMKHNSFSEEREWRLVIPILKDFNDANLPLIFTTQNNSVVPRVRYKFGQGPIREIIIGPGAHECSKDALSQFVSICGINPEVSLSIAPYRPQR